MTGQLQRDLSSGGVRLSTDSPVFMTQRILLSPSGVSYLIVAIDIRLFLISSRTTGHFVFYKT